MGMWTPEKALAIALVELLERDVANNVQYFQESIATRLRYEVTPADLQQAMDWLDRMARRGRLPDD